MWVGSDPDRMTALCLLPGCPDSLSTMAGEKQTLMLYIADVLMIDHAGVSCWVALVDAVMTARGEGGGPGL